MSLLAVFYKKIEIETSEYIKISALLAAEIL